KRCRARLICSYLKQSQIRGEIRGLDHSDAGNSQGNQNSPDSPPTLSGLLRIFLGCPTAPVSGFVTGGAVVGDFSGRGGITGSCVVLFQRYHSIPALHPYFAPNSGALSSPSPRRESTVRSVREPVRVIQALAFGVAASLVAGGAWTAVWFATPPHASEVRAALAPKSASTTIHLNSDPQGADAMTSLGSSCQTPCSIELVVERPFTVTFTHRGFVSSTVPVETEPPQPGTSDAKFSPDPVFAALQPIPEPKILEPKKKTERARV